MLVPILKAARPHQWVKNLFVAAPLVFAHRIGDPTSVVHTGVALVAFCLLSSAVYLVNDIFDVEKDRAHPTKCKRPIASGAIPVGVARMVAVGIAGVGLLLGAWLGTGFDVCALAYLGLNLAYSLALKRVAFVDVALLSTGFLLRVLGGSLAIPVHPSKWLLACTLLLSSFLAFGKRSHELRVAGLGKGVAQRDVLGKYTPKTLQRLLVILGALTTLTYLAYTRSMHAQSLVGSRPLVVTVPFVAFGIFRFAWLASRKEDAESPTDSMLRDIPFMVNLVLYGIAILWLVS